ncbi:MAG: MoxR family ATPase [Clostridia bacterium]|nr:MoxR family ATPase [Clostridia bacterium]
MTSLTQLTSLIRQNVALALVGKEEATDLLLIALLCEGHVLIEDVPGVGKTTLASALARSLSCSFARVQFTPDVTPSDLVGFSIPDRQGELHYRPGSVSSQLVLADEINRTSPKTQAALLEIMEEKQATVDGVTHPMPRPFMVMATQNPVDFVGTYPLPEAQMDRFLLRVAIGYPTAKDEADILLRYSGPDVPMDAVSPVCSAQDILEAQAAVRTVYVSYEVRAYIVALCDATRKTDLLALGASTRAAIALCRAAQARALLCGRDYVIPEDVQALAVSVLAHRLVLSADARMRGDSTADVTRQLLSVVRVPVKLK